MSKEGNGYLYPLPFHYNRCPQWWKNFVDHMLEDPDYIPGKSVNDALRKYYAHFEYDDKESKFIGLKFYSTEDFVAFKLKWIK